MPLPGRALCRFSLLDNGIHFVVKSGPLGRAISFPVPSLPTESALRFRSRKPENNNRADQATVRVINPALSKTARFELSKLLLPRAEERAGRHRQTGASLKRGTTSRTGWPRRTCTEGRRNPILSPSRLSSVHDTAAAGERVGHARARSQGQVKCAHIAAIAD